RSDKYWSGIRTDLTILKSTGALGHGSGISDSTLTKRIPTMLIVTTVSQQAENFCVLSFTTSEHRTDARDSRIRRDDEDVQQGSGGGGTHRSGTVFFQEK
ncbi:hypothetical protein AVEN_170031-2-1, partial [Araneus ventricosus]